MTKIVLQDLASLTNETAALAAINSNNALIETASDNSLSRDGTSPNEMNADLDMNSNRILNLPDPINNSEPLRLQDLTSFVGTGLVLPQASYVTMASSGTLTNERVLTAGNGVTVTDAGANSTATLALDTTNARNKLHPTSTDKAIARYAGTSGDLQNSGITISDTNAVAGALILATGSSVARNLETRFSEIVNFKDFNPVGDGTTDDLIPLTNFINAVMASPFKTGYMHSGVFAHTAALPQLNVDGVKIYGQGASSTHDTGTTPPTALTTIKYTGSAGATQWTIAPTTGASAQRLDGLDIKGIHFEANSLAAKGVLIQSTRNSDFDISVFNATTTGLELGVVTTLGESRDTQFNRIRYISRHADGGGASGVCLRLTGDASANVSFNTFQQVDCRHSTSSAIICDNADNNLWLQVRAFQASGAATNSIVWNGGATSAQSCRAETYVSVSATLAPIAKGTGTFTVGAQNIRILVLDKDNNTPDPTVEAGATAYFQNTATPIAHGWTTWTPTFTSAGGTLGTQTLNRARYIRYGLAVYFYIDVTITSAGTAPTGDVRFTLPVPAVNATTAGAINGREGSINNNIIGGVIDGSNSRGQISFNAGATATGNGNRLMFGGTYEAA